MARGGAGRTKEPVALTHRYIEALKPESDPYRIPDARCPSLAIRVAVDGSKTFDCAFRIKGGGFRRPSLGRWSDEIGLEDARDRVRELKKAARGGIDLLAEEKALAVEKASRITVGELIEKYCQKVVRGKLRTAKEIESRLKRALRTKLGTPGEEIKRRDLRELFDETAEAGHEREAKSGDKLQAQCSVGQSLRIIWIPILAGD